MSKGKALIRADIRRARRDHHALAEDFLESWRTVLAELGVSTSSPAALFVPTSSEPDVMGIVRECRRALLPVLVANGSRLLEPAWGWHEGGASLVQPDPAWPAQPDTPILGADALAGVDVVLVPALAVDQRGNRLGQGGGWYDRALLERRAGVAVVAAVFDAEFVDEATWPVEDHDCRVDAVITPSAGVILGG
ncbi:5-formyltetrahydrofolate cyclo-ligase [Schaalia vaccimaxillae]|uniref:5-formyltetrahydrofolate cyclo-ligase n=1 Tax=Schaalia vaccimaxillae TaxID=183916 RepID=UPI0003B67498|nr:5-formyltetrahydrofolate cyclo-ligase [Schaalia vaccimaxillae]